MVTIQTPGRRERGEFRDVAIFQRDLKEESRRAVPPLAVVSRGEVSAALTLSSLGVAGVAVAVAVTRSALGEAPVTRQAVGTLAPRGPWEARALACLLVAEGGRRPPGVTLAR